MLPPLQNHGKTTIFHICLFRSPCFPPKAGVPVAGRNTPLLMNGFIWSTDDISFVRLSHFPSQLELGVRILHTSLPEVEKEVFLSFFLLTPPRLSTDNITKHELAWETRMCWAWPWGAEGSLSPVSACLSPLVILPLSCQPSQEQCLTEKDELTSFFPCPSKKLITTCLFSLSVLM